MSKKLMLGNEAVANGAIDAGTRVVSSYPGTPSTEITEEIVKNSSDVYCEWAPNEKVALEVSIGASFAGARAMSCMKHVGLNVAADPLFTVAYTGVNGGLVVVVADDPGMHSSQNEQDSRFYARSAHVPMLEPADSQEAYDFTRKAFELSEQFDTPVIVRMTTRVAHSQSLVERTVPAEAELKEYSKNVAKYVMMPAQARGRHVAVEKRDNDIRAFADTLDINRMEIRDTKVGIICSGCVYQYVREAMPEASTLKLGMVFPLPQNLIREFAEKVDTLYVVEELEPFFENQIKVMGIECMGKELFGLQGELSMTKVSEKLTGKTREVAYKPEALPVRPPVLCPGCPHRGVFYVLNKLKLNVMGDIGCYTLGALAPLNAIDACVCMGASVGMAHGMEKARGEEAAAKTVAVIGDSTFVHSGITGLVDMVYNSGTSTVILLDNSITGMTGHQQNPATGKNIRGEVAPQLDFVKLFDAIGVKNVRVADPFDLKEFEKVVKEETARREVSVIIAKRPCALLDKTVKKPFKINSEKCKRCGMCMKIGCPAIQRNGDDIVIDSSLCNGCTLCSKICPFGAIEGEEQ